MVKCIVCGTEDKFLLDKHKKNQEHHLVPKFMGGTDRDGRVYLCPKHHNILHHIIASMIFLSVREEDRERCRKSIKAFSKGWIDRTK